MDKQQLLEALSILDRASAKAHLTREEHVMVQNSVNAIKEELEKREDGKH